MTIAFFGHAQFLKTAEAEQKIIDFLSKTVGNEGAELYLGGYGNFDGFAYDCCKKYRETHPRGLLVLVTPYLTDAYSRNHLEPQRARYDRILYPEIEDKPLKFAISYRNRRMVEKADHIVCGVEHSWGGAYQAFRYAMRKGKPIFNVGHKHG